jgi:hypothetical protein
LLQPGDKLGARRADYGDGHVTRLWMLRTLREVGSVPVADLKGIVDAVEDKSRSIYDMFGAACDSMTHCPTTAPPSDARSLAAEVVRQAGWTKVRPDSPARDRLAGLLAVISDLGAQFDPQDAGEYLKLVDAIARFELDQINPEDDRDTMMQQMVIGQVLFGEFLLNLRLLAQEHYSALRFRDNPNEVCELQHE